MPNLEDALFVLIEPKGTQWSHISLLGDQFPTEPKMAQQSHTLFKCAVYGRQVAHVPFMVYFGYPECANIGSIQLAFYRHYNHLH
jgi:hypothetical protein